MAQNYFLKTFLFIPLFWTLNIYGIQPNPQREGRRVTYRLNIDYKTVRYAGKDVQAMLINQSLPGPVLYFKEGDQAVIYVTNKMDQETSLHWHGILLPNFQDGVPYLTTPPIQPGQTYKFEFPLTHSGTYWYHSHTGLQEQRGILGGIVVQPKQKRHHYNKELVLHLSDWSNEMPDSIMRTLKRGSEWYAIKKKTVQSLNKVIAGGVLLPQLKMWMQRMPGMDISDVYYEAFLINGKEQQYYRQFKGGETVRLRLINASASTYFWLGLGGKPLLISADGVDVQPVQGNKLLHAIGETYDFLVTIPQGKSIEVKAVAQDGSGSARAVLGKGALLKAPFIPKYDPIEDMRSHGSHSSHSAHSSHSSSSGHKGRSGHGAHAGHGAPSHHRKDKAHHKKHGASGGRHKSHGAGRSMRQGHGAGKALKTAHSEKDHAQAKQKKTKQHKGITYDKLKALHDTSFSKNKAVKELNLNLTGNMRRYVWSINGKVLSETDVIPMKKNQVLRLNLRNKTMMHHPMHLHGHFFRVLNKHKRYSPLKHTVDVPPMETVTLEFESGEPGDWFFHCHVLYHMKAGMARIFRYGQRNKKISKYPLSSVMDMDKYWYSFVDWDIFSNHSNLELKFSNTRNKVSLDGEFIWFDRDYKARRDYELGLSYERFLNKHFRLYAELDIENEENSIRSMESTAYLGFRYLLPFLIDLDFSVDHQGVFELELDYDLLLFPRLELAVEWSWTADFHLFDKNTESRKLVSEYEWELNLEYILTKNMSLAGRYDSDLGWAGGVQLKF